MLNDTIKAKQKLLAKAYITTEQYMGQAIYCIVSFEILLKKLQLD